jgi:hypothetical protein
MKNIWKIDPIWAAQKYNSQVNIHSFDEVHYCSQEYINSLTESQTVSDPRLTYCSLNKRMTAANKRYIVTNFSIISEETEERIINLRGDYSLFWIGLSRYAQLGPFTIDTNNLFDVEKSFKRLNSDYAKPVVPEIEYLELN